MAGEENTEWTPKSRDDWKGLFKDSFTEAITGIRSADEEAAAKNQGGNNDGGDDKTGGDKNGGSNGGKGKSFADRLLGI